MAVVSQPDKPVGRGMKLVSTPTKQFALDNNIMVLQPAKVRNNEDFLNEIKDLNPDIIVVVAYGKILPQELLDIPKYGAMNVHGSLLPKYRGAAPIQWAIINGDKTTGITTMKMDAGMDTGDMYLKEEVEILEDDTYGTLYEKLKDVGAKLAVKTLEKIEAGEIESIKQPDDFTTAPMIFKENCKIDFNKSAKEICNLVRGVNPVPGAFTTLEGNVYKVWKAECISSELFNISSNTKVGTVIESDSKKGLFIYTGQDILSVIEIQAPNAKKMGILEYLRGKSIEVGKIFE